LKSIDKNIGSNSSNVNNYKNENIDMNKNQDFLKPLFDLSDAPILDFSAITTGWNIFIYIFVYMYIYMYMHIYIWNL
jgi:hypothetical protein